MRSRSRPVTTRSSPYYRACDGNCGRLDPARQLCSMRESLEADRRDSLIVAVGGDCTFTEVSPS